MGCSWRLEFWIDECSEEDQKKVKEILDKHEFYNGVEDEGDYLDVITDASYGFSINGWVKECRPELLKIKKLRIYQYCLEKEADEVFEND